MNKIKQFSEQQKLNMLKSLREGKMQIVDKDVLYNQVTIQVSTNLEDNAKVQDKDAFEEFKELYKDTIDDRCMQDYGTIEDKKLWEDCAKEMYLQSEQYIVNGDEFKPIENLNEDFGKYKIFTKSQYMKLAKKYGNKINNFDVKLSNGKFFMSIPDYNALIDEDEQDESRLQENLSDEQIDKLYDKMKKFAQEQLKIKDQDKLDAFMDENMPMWIQMQRNLNFKYEEDKAITVENKQDDLKFLSHITNGIITDIQNNFNVTATGELDTSDTNKVIVTLKGNTLDLIDATSYLAKAIRRDDVDFTFDDEIKNNTVTCIINPKNESKQVKTESRDDVAENLPKFIYDLDKDKGNAWSANESVYHNGVKLYCINKNGTSQNTAQDIIKAVTDKFSQLEVASVEYNCIYFKKSDKLQEDQYEAERRRGVPPIKRIVEQEVYDNEDWYREHINDYDNEDDFVEKNIAEIASEYNLKEDKAKEACRQIYKLALSLIYNKIEETKNIISEQDSSKKQANLTDGMKKQIAQQDIEANKEQLEQYKGLNDIIDNNIERICKTYNVLQPVAKDICAYIYNLLKED